MQETGQVLAVQKKKFHQLYRGDGTLSSAPGRARALVHLSEERTGLFSKKIQTLTSHHHHPERAKWTKTTEPGVSGAACSACIAGRPPNPERLLKRLAHVL
jgi:hypothetical protein